MVAEIHDLDPVAGRVLRAVDVHVLAIPQDLATVDGMDAGHALDQRGLAGAVVAHERHHLSGVRVEVDAVEGLDRAEALVHPLQLK